MFEFGDEMLIARGSGSQTRIDAGDQPAPVQSSFLSLVQARLSNIIESLHSQAEISESFVNSILGSYPVKDCQQGSCEKTTSPSTRVEAISSQLALIDVLIDRLQASSNRFHEIS